MYEAQGRKAPLVLRHPLLVRRSLMGLGALAGAIPAALKFSEGGKLTDALSSALLPSGLGATTGALAHALLHGDAKRRAQRAAENLTEYSGDPRNLRLGNPILAGLTGIHQQGRADVVRALEGEGVRPNHNPAMSGLDIGALIPVTSIPSMIGHAAGSGAHFIEAYDRMSPAGIKVATALNSSSDPRIASLVRGTQNQDVEELIALRKKRKKDEGFARSYKPLVIGGALAGLGYAAYRGGNWILSPEDRKKLTNVSAFLLNSDPSGDTLKAKFKSVMGLGNPTPATHIQGSDYAFYDYIDKMTQAATVKPFGKSVSSLLMGIRKHLGGKNKIENPNDWKGQLGAEHYDYFERGPLAAMQHQLHKLKPFYEDMHHTQFVPGGLEARVLRAKEIKDLLDNAEAAGKGQETYQQLLAEKLEPLRKNPDNLPDRDYPSFPDTLAGADKDHVANLLAQLDMRQQGDLKSVHGLTTRWQSLFDQYMREQTGKGYEEVPGLSSELGHGREMELVRGMPGWLRDKDPEFYQQFEPYLRQQATNQLGVAGAYSLLTDVVGGAQDGLRTGGQVGMAAGGGLAGLWAVKNMLRRRGASARKIREREKELKERIRARTAKSLTVR